MSHIHELLLRVREADEADYGKSVIRLHETAKPKDIRWGDYINISLDKKNWITCKLEPSGDIGTGKIYIGIHQRGLLNKDTLGVQIARLGVPCSFYVRKASPWRAPISIIGVIIIIAITFLIYFLTR